MYDFSTIWLVESRSIQHGIGPVICDVSFIRVCTCVVTSRLSSVAWYELTAHLITRKLTQTTEYRMAQENYLFENPGNPLFGNCYLFVRQMFTFTSQKWILCVSNSVDTFKYNSQGYTLWSQKRAIYLNKMREKQI